MRTHAETRDALAEARASLLQMAERADGLSARLDALEVHRASLEQKHAHARDALDHFRTAAKEQRDQDSRRHEHQVQEFQATARQVGEALTGARQEVLQLNRDNARLSEQLAQRDKALLDAQGALRQAERDRAVHASLETEHRALKARWEDQERELARRDEALAATRAQEADHRQARDGAEREVTRLASRLEVFEAWVRQEPERPAGVDLAPSTD